ncbi:hypothetical protein CERSUDRAFT_97277 [Gelatoporia subvermispora B]|uniref:Uncharacterized protein n=1 Tax=Ceriporiopsis subvermispora (strain B) TaxID=914234 RepID=M2QCE3_CERS8|nr:hypothetical protein CERSUDRAFT_97277 [Gelatoporia subvermispora B]
MSSFSTNSDTVDSASSATPLQLSSPLNGATPVTITAEIETVSSALIAISESTPNFRLSVTTAVSTVASETTGSRRHVVPVKSIVGGTVGSLVGMVMLIACVMWCLRRRRVRENGRLGVERFDKRSENAPVPPEPAESTAVSCPVSIISSRRTGHLSQDVSVIYSSTSPRTSIPDYSNSLTFISGNTRHNILSTSFPNIEEDLPMPMTIRVHDDFGLHLPTAQVLDIPPVYSAD